MNKDECISKFVATLIIAFPFMAMFAFLVELFTIETFIEISKNHGSLIAGIIGFIGVFILVWNQNQSTKKTVEATLQAIHTESIEIEKRACRECILKIIQCINNILRLDCDAQPIQEIQIAVDESNKLVMLLTKEYIEIEHYRLIFIHNYLEFYEKILTLNSIRIDYGDDLRINLVDEFRTKTLESCKFINMSKHAALSFLSKTIDMQSVAKSPFLGSGNVWKLSEDYLNEAETCLIIIKQELDQVNTNLSQGIYHKNLA